MKINIKKIICFMILGLFLISTNALAMKIAKNETELKIIKDTNDNYDPLVNLKVTVKINEIRTLDKIDMLSDPDFYVKVFIDDQVYTSETWNNQKYVKPNWSATCDVNDYKDYVNIRIQLWDANPGRDTLCDISQNVGQVYPRSYDVDLNYSLKTGHWDGEDFIHPNSVYFDPSGYGRLNGCDDNSIYENDKDCELWFDITQTDYDGDGIPYWTEVYEFGTDPKVDDTGKDYDEDGIPIEWEFKWGYYQTYNWHEKKYEDIWFYHPCKWDDHKNIDEEDDGLDNVEEYLTSQWGSDPFRRDLFIELDQMVEGPQGEHASILPNGSKILLIDAHHRHNIVYHMDDGCMGGSDWIPFDYWTEHEELQDIYFNYFLHGDKDNWRRGVFHYGIIVYDATYSGFCFDSGDKCYGGAFQMSSVRMDNKNLLHTDWYRDINYAGGYMHETGHTLGLNGFLIGGHDRDSYYPWQYNFWKFQAYKSCMNYRYVFKIVDYSDGSNGLNDFDDWEHIDLSLFQDDV